MLRQDIIDTIEELMENIKESGVSDLTEYGFCETIYALENVVNIVHENED